MKFTNQCWKCFYSFLHNTFGLQEKHFPFYFKFHVKSHETSDCHINSNEKMTTHSPA